MGNSYLLNKESLISYFVVFIVIDLLFLPNFLASTPLSFYLLILLSPFLLAFKKEEVLIYIMFLVCMLASVTNGLTIYSSGSQENIKRLIQLSLVLLLVFLNFKRINFSLVERLIIRVVTTFVFYTFTLFLVSILASDLYISIMSVLSPNAAEMISANVDMFRFSYMFSDPNTFGYLLVFISIYYLYYTKVTLENILVIFLTLVLILSTQSRGALLSFACFITFFYVANLKISLASMKKSFFIILFLVSVFFIFQDYFLFISEAFEKRSEIEEAMGTGLGGGRDKKYYYLISNFNLSFYGVGYSLFIDGIEFRPHSDLIRIILSYGTFSLFLFFLLFLPNNRKSFLLLFSFLFPFLLNSVIDDYRIFGLFVILLMFTKYDRRLL